MPEIYYIVTESKITKAGKLSKNFEVHQFENLVAARTAARHIAKEGNYAAIFRVGHTTAFEVYKPKVTRVTLPKLRTPKMRIGMRRL